MSKTLLQLAKLQRSGTILREPLSSQLKEELLACASYKRAAEKPDMVLKVMTKYIYKRRIKTVFITYGSTCIPVVATKLYAKKKQGCRSCKSKTCYKSVNNGLLRESIEPQIKNFKRKIKKRVNELRLIGSRRTADQGNELKLLSSCALTGEPLINVHVDHITPFSHLVKKWCKNNSLDLCSKRFNRKQLTDFANWHKEVAELQLTNARANMRKGNRV